MQEVYLKKDFNNKPSNIMTTVRKKNLSVMVLYAHFTCALSAVTRVEMIL